MQLEVISKELLPDATFVTISVHRQAQGHNSTLHKDWSETESCELFCFE